MSQNKVPMRMPTSLMGNANTNESFAPLLVPLAASRDSSASVRNLTLGYTLNDLTLVSKLDNDGAVLAPFSYSNFAYLTPVYVPKNLIPVDNTREVSFSVQMPMLGRNDAQDVCNVDLYVGVYKQIDNRKYSQFLGATSINFTVDANITIFDNLELDLTHINLFESGLYWFAAALDYTGFSNTRLFGLGNDPNVNNIIMGNHPIHNRTNPVTPIDLDIESPSFGFEQTHLEYIQFEFCGMPAVTISYTNF